VWPGGTGFRIRWCCVSTPRNAGAVERSLREREEIRRAWLDLLRQRPFARHSAKDVARLLPFQLSDEAINWHLRKLDQAETVDADTLPTEQCSDDSRAA
jgi:hypothetical protein